MTDGAAAPTGQGPDPFRPIQIIEVELAAPLRRITAATSGSGRPCGSILALVRLHTIPIGVLEMPFDPDVIEPEALATNLAASLADDIRTHLEADGLEPDLTPLPAGLPTPRAPACRTTLEAAIADGRPVSLVVPTADRPRALRGALIGLVAQSYPGAEIIVVDNAPDRSGARAVVDEIADGRIRYVVEPRPGASAARNRGLVEASHPITVFLDGDVRVDRDWLAHMVAPFIEDRRVAAVTGLVMPAELETQAQVWMEEWGGFGKGFRPRSFDLDRRRGEGPLYPYSASLGSGQSMAFRTAVLRELGGFDEALGPRTPAEGGEDIAALLDVVLAGQTLAYAPAAIVWHPHERDEDGFLDKLRSYGVGLTAHMTRIAVRHPRSALDMGVRVPAALRYFLASGSDRNRHRHPGFPTAAVRRAELAGFVRGPFAYARSHRRRQAPLKGR